MEKNILIVDDDRLLTKALSTAIALLQYKVHTASNGSAAIDIISQQQIDLVICDLMMPQISGISFVSAIKRTYNPDIPIIIMSTRDAGQQIAQNLNYKKIVFLAKPFSFEKISETIKELLN
jgi:DNA-binding NtrC family response regulator